MATIYQPGTTGPWYVDDDGVIVDNTVATVDGLGGGGTVTSTHPRTRQLAPMKMRGRPTGAQMRTNEDQR